MFVPTFSFSLSHPIQSNLVVSGKFDGIHPSLAFATLSGNVLIHCPYGSSMGMNHDFELKLNQNINQNMNQNINQNMNQNMNQNLNPNQLDRSNQIPEQRSNR